MRWCVLMIVTEWNTDFISYYIKNWCSHVTALFNKQTYLIIPCICWTQRSCHSILPSVKSCSLNLHWYACHSKVNYVCLMYVFHFFLPHTPQVISFWFTFITLIETDEWIRFVSFDFSFKNCDLQHCDICPCFHPTGRATLYDHRGWVLWCCRCYSGQNGEGGGEGTYLYS